VQKKEGGFYKKFTLYYEMDLRILRPPQNTLSTSLGRDSWFDRLVSNLRGKLHLGAIARIELLAGFAGFHQRSDRMRGC
jgi:hypothetical protein